MKNTPSALKWLAEKRGRLARDLAVTKQIAEDVARRVEVLQMDLDAMDRALTIFNPAIEPDTIGPVQAHRPYGKRGALKGCVVACCRSTHRIGWPPRPSRRGLP